MTKPRTFYRDPEQKRLAALRKKIGEMEKLLLEYRDEPNCGEYGVTRGWQDRVDKAIGKVNRK